MLFTKHIHVLHLLSEIPAPVSTLVPGELYTRNTAMTMDEAAAAFDHIFEYIHAHWCNPLTALSSDKTEWDERYTTAEQAEITDCRAMLVMNHQEIIEKLASLPPYFREEIFPVAVARYMLRELRMPIRHQKSVAFPEFSRRYSTMILA